MKRGTVTLLRGDATSIPLEDRSVHLVVTSPPYFALRSYRDGGEHYDGQIGSEATPLHFLAALWAVMDEVHRVLVPTGSAFVNLGDKFAGSHGHNNGGLAKEHSVRAARGEDTGLAAAQNRATRRQAPDRYNQEASGLLAKSRMLLPHRFAEGLIDPEYRAWIESRIGIEAPAEGHPQWLCRMDVVWAKKNSMPESVQDRVRAAHEYIFHLTKQGDYYASVDAIRDAYTDSPKKSGEGWLSSNEGHVLGRVTDPHGGLRNQQPNPLGKLPGSVWTMATEPLITPDYMVLAHGDDLAPAVWLKDDREAWLWAEAAGVLSTPWPRPTGDDRGPFLVAAPHILRPSPRSFRPRPSSAGRPRASARGAGRGVGRWPSAPAPSSRREATLCSAAATPTSTTLLGGTTDDRSGLQRGRRSRSMRLSSTARPAPAPSRTPPRRRPSCSTRSAARAPRRSSPPLSGAMGSASTSPPTTSASPTGGRTCRASTTRCGPRPACPSSGGARRKACPTPPR